MNESGNATGLLALVMALAAAGGVGYLFYERQQPPKSPLEQYDFSSPTAAMKSQWRMAGTFDYLAMREAVQKAGKEELEEKLSTLQVKKEVEWHGNRILFVTYKSDGTSIYSTPAFTKHANTGYWVGKPVLPFEVEKDNKALAKEMERWRDSGSLEPVSKK
jgi:hypothetical protein